MVGTPEGDKVFLFDMDIKTIIKSIAEYHGLSYSDIVHKNNSHYVAMVRHTAIYILKNKFDLTHVSIGQYIGNRDHSTITNSLKRFDPHTYPNQFKRINEIMNYVIRRGSNHINGVRFYYGKNDSLYGIYALNFV